MPFTTKDIPSLTGKTALVTGANTGLGYETAYVLAHAGANVYLAVRNPAKGEAARERILASKPSGSAEVAVLDLSDLDKVKAFAAEFAKTHAHLDILVANAGVMLPNPPTKTVQGHEVQFGVNHLAHAALIGTLFPLLKATPSSRVVTVASFAHKRAEIDLDDLDWTKRTYNGAQVYAQSKLANLLWARELARRTAVAGLAAPLVTLAHPGWTLTELQRDSTLVRMLSKVLAQSVQQGALPQIYAATAPDLEPGSYWGPQGWWELAGSVGPASISPGGQDRAVAAQLFDTTEQLTGVKFDLSA